MQAKRRRARTKRPGVYRSVSGRYEIAYTDSDGRFVQKTVADTYEEAKTIRADIISKVGKGEQVRDTRLRFEDFATQVIDALSKRPRTIEKHSYHLRKHLRPVLGTKRLSEITTNDVARLVAKMDSDGAAGWTISGALSTLSLVMRRAKRQGLILANPVADLERDERPSLGRTEKRSLDQVEITALLAKAGDTFRPLIATMIFTGLRIGEALGLQWKDVDFDSKCVHSERNSIGRASAHPSSLRRGDEMSYSWSIATVLRKQRERAFARGGAKPGDYVFVNPDGSPRSHGATSRGVGRAIKRANLGRRPELALIPAHVRLAHDRRTETRRRASCQTTRAHERELYPRHLHSPIRCGPPRRRDAGEARRHVRAPSQCQCDVRCT